MSIEHPVTLNARPRPKTPWFVGCFATMVTLIGDPAFVNWECAPVHPLDLSPDSQTIAVANLPAARLELFDAQSDPPAPTASIPVGLDPVTARFHSNDEIWVACHISDAINVIDLKTQSVKAVIQSGDGPADIVFAGSPVRAYVSCAFENRVQVIDPNTYQIVDSIPIKGQRPKSLARSPDGTQVYVAIFESGNASTILAPRFGLDFVPGSVVDFHDGPYQGVNPPPNSGAQFDPPIATHLSDPPPRVSLIVKKNASGRWMDDNGGDWSDYVSGSKAPLSGRPVGWDMPDRDLAVINTTDHSVAYQSGLMTMCMNVAVHPTTGQISVIGTDARNEVRFEPKLNGRFIDVQLAWVDPRTHNAERHNLNPHLGDREVPLPKLLRMQSIGDPRQLEWAEGGSVAYIAGMGSDNLIKINPQGQRLGAAPIPLEGGPTALAADPIRQRLYVYQRFSNRLSVLNTEDDSVLSETPLFDPTPESIRKGRPHFYNTKKTSGTGHLSCASCHVDGRFDRLAWDLGTPEGPSIPVDNTSFEDLLRPDETHPFHPMKGPMVTMTMQDIIGHEPFHWRGDRRSIEAFNPTFTDLQGAEHELSHREMAEFKAFLATLHFPPNRYRTLSNRLSTNVPLHDHHALGRDGNGRATGELFTTGDAQSGRLNFLHGSECIECHTQSTGLGPHMRFRRRGWEPIPDGPMGERHVSLVQQARSNDLPFKIASLRGLADKVGANFLSRESDVGFGFSHNGAVDSLVRFVQDGFNIVEDKSTADLVAFLLSFTGSELSMGHVTTRDNPPGLPSKDTHAAVGKQFLITDPTMIPETLSEVITNATRNDDRVDLIALQQGSPESRWWHFDPQTQQFQSDSSDTVLGLSALLETATPENSFLFTVVPPGSGTRMAFDWDLDGVSNQAELEQGFNPYNARSSPTNHPPIIRPVTAIALSPGEALDLKLEIGDGNDPADPLIVRLIGQTPDDASIDQDGHLRWLPPASLENSPWIFEVEVTDQGVPPMTSQMSFPVFAINKQGRPRASAMSVAPDEVTLIWRVIPGQTFQVSHSTSLSPPLWFPLTEPWTADESTWQVKHARQSDQAHFYRIETLND